MALVIKGWGKFQHFKDRKPPWVKLYRDILDDHEWHELDAEAAKALVMLWLLASEDEGRLPDVKKIAFRLRITEQKCKSLIDKLSHWLIREDIGAISDQHQEISVADVSDHLETETETETETEKTLSGKPDVAVQILEFLNFKTGRNYQPVKANIEMIKARLKDGATVDELRMVVAKKCREWATDEKMNEYLRPATLFNRTKFAQYQGELLKD